MRLSHPTESFVPLLRREDVGLRATLRVRMQAACFMRPCVNACMLCVKSVLQCVDSWATFI